MFSSVESTVGHVRIKIDNGTITVEKEKWQNSKDNQKEEETSPHNGEKRLTQKGGTNKLTYKTTNQHNKNESKNQHQSQRPERDPCMQPKKKQENDKKEEGLQIKRTRHRRHIMGWKAKNRRKPE